MTARRSIALLLLALALVWYEQVVPAHAACGWGKPLSERVIITPRPASFYSVDALNPDVVRSHGRYLMLFSGNSLLDAAGGWSTGLAMADRPNGPFVVDQSVSHPFFNGGTLAFKGRLLHLGSVPDWVAPVLHESADGGRGWERLSAMPVPRGPSWRALQSDAYVYRKRPGIAVYFAAREGASGAHIGSARYRNGRWTRFRVALNRVPGTWDGLDLGEPAVFRARGTTWMLYGGLGGHGEPRHIGLARLTSRGWRRCGSEPFVSAGRGWYLSNAIDPEPEVVGDRLYLYFGGGLTPSLGGNMRGTIGLRVYRLPKRR